MKEKGMYVRTEEGKIFKTDGDEFRLINNKKTLYRLLTRIPYSSVSYKVSKASYNIIDLIDFGDMVNRLQIGKYKDHLGVFLIYESRWEFVAIEDYVKENSFFLEIITKEQLENIGYKVSLWK